MKIFYRVMSCLLIGLLFTVSTTNEVKACDRTQYVLDSATFDGTNYTIYTTFCVGGGIIGSTRGADNWTGTFAFAIYGSPTLTMSAYTPPSMTSDTTGCFQPSTTFTGSFGANVGVAYINTGSCFYTCVSSTALCGRPHSDCNQFVITLNEIPDSIRLYGMEGTGNPVAGCYPNPDMLIDFTTLPVVWASLDAQMKEEVVEVSWATAQEVNNDHFRVLRSGNSANWVEIGQVEAAANAENGMSYSFIDESPLQGTNQYKIVQVDDDGRTSESEVVSVTYVLDVELDWREIGPNPTADLLNLSFVTDMEFPMDLQVYNLKGEKVLEQAFTTQYGLNKMTLDLTAMSNGVYILQLKGSYGSLNKKIIKI